MKRILAASLSLIGFTTSVCSQEGLCQAAAANQRVNVKNALPGAARPNTQSGAGNLLAPGVDLSNGGKNSPVSAPADRVKLPGAGNLNPGIGTSGSGAGLQDRLNPGRIGDPLGAVQGNLGTGLNALEQSVTDKIGVGKVTSSPSTGATGSSGPAGGAATDNRSLQDKLVDVAEGQAAGALDQDPNGNFAGTSTSGGGQPGGGAAAGSGAAGVPGESGTGASGGSGRNEGEPRTPAGTGESGTTGSSESGGGSGDTGHTTGTSHGSRNGGEGIFEHPTTGQAGAVSAPGSGVHIEQDNLNGVNANVGGNVQNRLRNGIGGSQFNGQNVSTFSAPAPDGAGKTGRQLPSGARFSGVGNAAGSGQATGVKTNLPGLNNRVPGAGIFTPRDSGAVGSAGIKGGANINNVGNSGVSTPNVNIGSGAKLDIGRGALGNTSVGNINQQINQLNDVAAGQAADGRPGDRAGGSVPGGGIQHGEITGTGSGQTTIFDNPEPHQVIGGSGQGFGGANGEVDFVPDSQNRTPEGTSSGSFGNPNNSAGTDPSAGSGRVEGESRTPAGTGDHTSTHSESGGSGSGDGGDSASTGHVAGHDDSRTSGDHDRRGGGDGGSSSIFEHPTNGTAGAVSGAGVGVDSNIGNVGVDANVGANVQNAAGALKNGAVGRFGAQLNGVEVQTFSKQNEGGAPANTGFRNGASPFGAGGRFSGIAAPAGNAGLPGATTPLNLPGRAITSPVSGIGGRIPGAVNTGLTGAGGATVRSLPGAGATGGGGLPGLGAIKIPTGNISPVGGLRPNLPNLGAGAGSIKLTPNLNLGGATPSRGNQPGGAQRTPANTGRPNIPAPGRR